MIIIPTYRTAQGNDAHGATADIAARKPRQSGCSEMYRKLAFLVSFAWDLGLTSLIIHCRHSGAEAPPVRVLRNVQETGICGVFRLGSWSNIANNPLQTQRRGSPASQGAPKCTGNWHLWCLSDWDLGVTSLIINEGPNFRVSEGGSRPVIYATGVEMRLCCIQLKYSNVKVKVT